ncbi:uncharacterized protein J3D65DRAFT_665967 [Phyllosticta citribraziliensis]|uniref:Uncharacterized protein n=1 Tax=Phyllosticta citribraziliensis TaxID=989973 RepID=A0ABR1M1B3_9PEZI
METSAPQQIHSAGTPVSTETHRPSKAHSTCSSALAIIRVHTIALQGRFGIHLSHNSTSRYTIGSPGTFTQPSAHHTPRHFYKEPNQYAISQNPFEQPRQLSQEQQRPKIQATPDACAAGSINTQAKAPRQSVSSMPIPASSTIPVPNDEHGIPGPALRIDQNALVAKRESNGSEKGSAAGTRESREFRMWLKKTVDFDNFTAGTVN